MSGEGGVASRYSEVQCIMDNGHMGWDPPVNRHRPVKNIAFPQPPGGNNKLLKFEDLGHTLWISDVFMNLVYRLWSSLSKGKMTEN